MPIPSFSQFIEAENMELSGYAVESVKAASGGQSVKTSGTGIAQATFNGTAGSYFLNVGTFDENDGRSTLEILINGIKIDEIRLDMEMGVSGATDANKVFYLRGPFSLSPGDVIAIRGTRDLGEVARLDSIQLLAEEGPAEDLVLNGDDTDNVLTGDSGNDLISGVGGNDTLSGEAGNDTMDGGDGDDRLEGGLGEDMLTGGKGNDYLSDIDGGHSRIFGGEGSDTIVMEGADNYLEAGSGDDRLIINYGNNAVIYMGEGNDLVNGSDERTGTTIYGDAGDDTLNGASGNDTIEGGTGNDYIRAYDDLEDNLNDTQAGGQDILTGGDGNDFIFGEVGRDTLRGGADNDWLDGGEGSDRIQGDDGSDTLIGGGQQDRLTGGNGADIFRYEFIADSRKNYTTADAQTDVITDFQVGVDKLDLSSLGFTALGNGSGTTLTVSYSASANRTYIKSFVPDEDGYRFEIAMEGDKRSISASDILFTSDMPQQVIIGTNEADIITGSFESEIIYGLAGNDTLRSGIKLSGQIEGNADLIYGGDGNDDIFMQDGKAAYGEDGDDKLESEFGPALLDGGNGNDLIIGSRAPDVLLGGAGRDRIIGTLDLEDSSSDIIDGGAGADLLTGTDGSDMFIFSALRDSAKNYQSGDVQVDGITARGFEAGLDKIDVSELGFTGLGDGTGTSLTLSYSAATDRTYVKSRVEDDDGYRFEFYIEGDQTQLLTTSDFIFF